MTYKAKLWSTDEARKELAYISSVNPREPGRTFNNDPTCFAGYCNMQANHALASGFALIAHDMAQARDIANPQYRSEMREHANAYVNGVFVTATYEDWADICSARNAC